MAEFVRQFKAYPLGANLEADGSIRFSFASKETDCGVIIYDRTSGKRINKLPFKKTERIGNVYCKYVEGYDTADIAYHFYEKDRIVADTRARLFVGKHIYGRERGTHSLRAGFITTDFDWQGDERPHIPYDESIIYLLHVRGFTKHSSSGVAHKGTYAGIVEKIDYLKKIGVTTIELQPTYDFAELPDNEERRRAFPGSHAVSDEDLDKYYPKRLNYWGYKTGYYYAPKASYAVNGDATVEFKEMVRALHSAGIEVVMQFYFPDSVERNEIPEILQFWVINYHIDGFHLMGNNIPTSYIARYSILSDTKLWYYGFDIESVYEANEVPKCRNLAEYNDEYMYSMRRYLKGDEGMLNTVISLMKANPAKLGRINFFSNYFGFTLADMVSYERKHNEANGENNRDGNDNNCTWNCGAEGTTKKGKVRELRKKQIKNAMSLLILSQGTPLIFMGDEFGNSEGGNNNPYCQDNLTTWLDWRLLDKNQEYFEFWEKLVKIRRSYSVIHSNKNSGVYSGAGKDYPGISVHGQNAWRPQLESYNRHLGVMFCGREDNKKEDGNGEYLYLAMNTYWEKRNLALPRLPKGMKWERVFTTANEEKEDKPLRLSPAEDEDALEFSITERSVELFRGVLDKKSSGSRVKKTGKR